MRGVYMFEGEGKGLNLTGERENDKVSVGRDCNQLQIFRRQYQMP